MYGINMRVATEKVSLLLRPATKDDLPELVKHFSSMQVHMYTMGRFAQTLENEHEWYEKVRKNDDECIWLIQPVDYNLPIGVTCLHHINGWDGSCSSGIIIWDPSWWGRGVASAAHLGRTLFAADYLNKYSIRSSVRVDNTASRRALERVGYTVWGTEPVDDYRAGRWIDTYQLKWFHPDKDQFYYPDGLPEKFVPGIERAKIALTKARQVVTFP
jgi:RimJ/RimL family protein N-acetyltransferase